MTREHFITSALLGSGKSHGVLEFLVLEVQGSEPSESGAEFEPSV